MLHRAAYHYLKIQFIQADAHAIALKGKFDIIILSDLVNDLWDVQVAFENPRQLTLPRTLLILNSYRQVWEKKLNYYKAWGYVNPTWIKSLAMLACIVVRKTSVQGLVSPNPISCGLTRRESA